jgi:WD40 repeat protein
MFKRLFFLLLFLVLSTIVVSAQGAPEQINVALSELSNRVGRTLALGDLANWEWSQDNYPDTSLGCPQPDQVYAQVVTPGYQFLFTYGGTIYDYRVSADQTIIFLCSSVGEGEPTLTPTPVDPNAIDVSIPCLNPEAGIIYQQTQLIAGIQAQVTPGVQPNNLRSEPRSDAELTGQIPAGAVFEIIAGPQCANGLVWWQVDFDGTIGWTAEGEGGTYWLEPLPMFTLPLDLSPITLENAAEVAELSRGEGNFLFELAWLNDGSAIAVLGGRGSEGVWLYVRDALDESPRLLRDDTQMLSVDAAPDRHLLTGDANGGVHLWDLRPDAPLLEATFLQGHSADTSAVAYDGSVFASVGETAFTTALVERTNAILLWNAATVSQQNVLSGHRARVNTLAFSPDGTLLASGSGTIDPDAASDNTIRIWEVATGAQRFALEGHTAPVRSVAFSPDGTLLASGSLDGTVRIWDVATGEQVRMMQHGTGNGVTSVAFSPDGALLASAGGNPNAETQDNGIHIWNVETGEQVALLEGHTAIVGSVAFSPDGTVLASVGDDRALRLWGVGAAG